MNNLHVVSANWLHEHLHDPQVVVVDCRFSLMDLSTGQKFNGVEESLGIEMKVKDEVTQEIKPKTKNAFR
jgi:3-mercaptopyruvate sulfurtransferase SseA